MVSVAVFKRNLLLASSRRCSEDGGSLFPQNSIHYKLFFVCAEGNKPNDFWVEMSSLN